MGCTSSIPVPEAPETPTQRPNPLANDPRFIDICDLFNSLIRTERFPHLTETDYTSLLEFLKKKDCVVRWTNILAFTKTPDGLEARRDRLLNELQNSLSLLTANLPRCESFTPLPHIEYYTTLCKQQTDPRKKKAMTAAWNRAVDHSKERSIMVLLKMNNSVVLVAVLNAMQTCFRYNNPDSSRTIPTTFQDVAV